MCLFTVSHLSFSHLFFLSLTHRHTHTSPLCLFLLLSVFLPLSLSPTYKPEHTHAQTHRWRVQCDWVTSPAWNASHFLGQQKLDVSWPLPCCLFFSRMFHVEFDKNVHGQSDHQRQQNRKWIRQTISLFSKKHPSITSAVVILQIPVLLLTKQLLWGFLHAHLKVYLPIESGLFWE